MKPELIIAGLTCLVIALGHATVAVIWVLPGLREDRMPSTPFGPASMTAGMVRFTFHVVTVMLLSFGALLLTLAWAEDADPKMLLLRWLAALWIAATATAFWTARRHPRYLLRLPVWLLFVLVAVLCWKAST